MSFYMEFGGKVNGFFRRNKEICLDIPGAREKMIASMRQQCNNTDVYYCTYVYDDNKNRDKAKFYSPLYFDIDAGDFSEENFSIARNDTQKLIMYLKTWYFLKEEDIHIFFSGSKGFHLIIPPEVLGVTPDNLLNIIYGHFVKRAARLMKIETIDTRIYDNKRLLRMVNSINGKTGLYKIPITHEQMKTLSLEAISEYAKQPREMAYPAPKLNSKAVEVISSHIRAAIQERQQMMKADKRPVFIPKTKKPLLPCAKTLLLTPAPKGRRNNTLVALSSSLLQSGWKKEEAREVLLQWNSNNEAPLTQYEIDRTIKSSFDMLSHGKRYGCGAYQDLMGNKACCQNCAVKQKKQNKVEVPKWKHKD